MNERQEKLLDLLTEKASFGLTAENEAALNSLLVEFPEWKDEDSFAKSAAAINLIAVDANENMPANLRSRITADAERFFDELETPLTLAQTETSGFSWHWLGWAVAAVACIALAVNVFILRRSPPPELTMAEQREQMMASAPDMMSAAWSDFDPKNPKNVQGDVVWSNSQQKGFIRFRNLPVNDKTKETYQLWIFDENQNAKTPIDGGVFDAGQTGEIIIQIEAKLRVEKPAMFAVTAEKPGGVVVSELGKVMAVAKVGA